MSQRKFSEEFKAEAMKLVKEQGLSTAQVAADLSVGKSTLEKWLRTGNGTQEATISEGEREELKRLRKENHTLRMERDILKKATAFFSKHTI